MERKNRRLCLLLLLACVLALTACGSRTADDLPPPPEEGVLIYAALNPPSKELLFSVNQFNNLHEDVQIEIRDYSDEAGPERLRIELVLGQVPDIMEMHRIHEVTNYHISEPYEEPFEDEYWLPYRQMAQKGYLEDLWPYIENDPKLGREQVLEAPLKAAEFNGGLYMIFRDFSVSTLIGPTRVVGDRSGWTLEELLDAYAGMPAGSTIMRYNLTRKDVFYKMLTALLGQYIDWETGECTFDSKGFHDLVQFLKTFPEEFKTDLSKKKIYAECAYRMMDGEQMLEAVTLSMLRHTKQLDFFFWEPVSFIGYPTADGEAGSFFRLHGKVLAMSAACQNKDAAWEFMSPLLKACSRNFHVQLCHSLEFARKNGGTGFHVNRISYENGIYVDIHDDKRYNATPGPSFAFHTMQLPGYNYNLYQYVLADCPDEEDAQRLENLINSTTQLYWPDDDLSNIVWEALGPYFAGDKTLDQTVALLNNRVGLYLNEQR